jgi:hypothetical protein
VDIERSNIADEAMYLSIAQVWVRSTDLIRDPVLARLAAEDAAWRFSFEDWRLREPSVWRRSARRRWLADGRSVFEARSCLRGLARRIGTSPQQLPDPIRPRDESA